MDQNATLPLYKKLPQRVLDIQAYLMVGKILIRKRKKSAQRYQRRQKIVLRTATLALVNLLILHMRISTPSLDTNWYSDTSSRQFRTSHNWPSTSTANKILLPDNPLQNRTIWTHLPKSTRKMPVYCSSWQVCKRSTT